MNLIVSLVLGLAACVAATPATVAPHVLPDVAPAAGQAQVTSIVLLHDNDLHFDMTQRAAFEAKLSELREAHDNIYLLNAGDVFVRHAHRWSEPSLDYYAERSRFMIEAMNELGYAAMVLGNHELDYKSDHTRAALRLARFPLLGANVVVSVDKLDQPKPYTILETVAGHTIAVLGLGTGGGPGVETLSPSETVARYAYLRDEHAVFVLLTHLGYTKDKQLAKQFGFIDVIIGGHSHTLLERAEMVNGVLIAQTGGHPHRIDESRPKQLGVVRLLLEDGVVVKKSGEVLSLP